MATKCNYYISNGLYYVAYDFTEIVHQVLSADEMGDQIEFCFATRQVFNVANIHLAEQGGLWELEAQLKKHRRITMWVDESASVITLILR